jgi:hypothetical protein
MPLLSQKQLLEVWERGRNQHPVDQALTILTLTSKNQTRHELAELCIGQRDNRLLALRERIFGEALHGEAVCPDCNERVEISFNINEIRAESTGSDNQESELAFGDYRIRFRVLNSWDLAAIAGCTNDERARSLIIERCLVQIVRNEVPIDSNQIPEEVIRKAEQAIAERDPQAEILLDLNCPECGGQWQLLFDIVTFLWTEITAKAKRLLWEIHSLAKAYGWTEAEILELSDGRRQIYLEMTSA